MCVCVGGGEYCVTLYYVGTELCKLSRNDIVYTMHESYCVCTLYCTMYCKKVLPMTGHLCASLCNMRGGLLLWIIIAMMVRMMMVMMVMMMVMMMMMMVKLWELCYKKAANSNRQLLSPFSLPSVVTRRYHHHHPRRHLLACSNSSYSSSKLSSLTSLNPQKCLKDSNWISKHTFSFDKGLNLWLT